MKKNVAVTFGGKTCEHDVSIITGHQILENADSTKYNMIPIYITRDGKWYTGEKLWDMEFYKAFDPKAVTQVYLEPTDGDHALYPCVTRGGLFGGGARKPVATLDVVIPAMHGMNGEDGTLQGLFELNNIPYASAGVMGSSVGMDKIAMRLLFQGAGFPVLESCHTDRNRFQTQREAVLDDIEGKVPYPMFVKPANLGSSIGISKATDRASLAQALEVAFHYDRRVLVERGIDCVEINCSAMGFGEDVEVGLCEQPVTWEQFLTFDEKYLRGVKGGKSQGMKSLSRLVPAPLEETMTARIQQLTQDIFRVLDCRGVVRIDYMIEKATGDLYVNEINTLPGSFAFYLWEPKGVSFKDLIDRIIASAEQAHAAKNANVYAFDSSILDQFKAGGGVKGGKLGAK